MPDEPEVGDRQDLKPESALQELVPRQVPALTRAPRLRPAPEPGSYELVDGEVVLRAPSWETIQAAVVLRPGDLPVQELWVAHLATTASADEELLDPGSDLSAFPPVVLVVCAGVEELWLSSVIDSSRRAPGTEKAVRRLRCHGEPVEEPLVGEIGRLEELEICVRAPADDRAPLVQRKGGKAALEDLAVADVSGLGPAHAVEEILEVCTLKNILDWGSGHVGIGDCFCLPAPAGAPSGSSLELPLGLKRFSLTGVLIEGILGSWSPASVPDEDWDLDPMIAGRDCASAWGQSEHLQVAGRRWGLLGFLGDFDGLGQRIAQALGRLLPPALVWDGELLVVLARCKRILGDLSEESCALRLGPGRRWLGNKEGLQEGTQTVREGQSLAPFFAAHALVDQLVPLGVADVPALGDISS